MAPTRLASVHGNLFGRWASARQVYSGPTSLHLLKQEDSQSHYHWHLVLFSPLVGRPGEPRPKKPPHLKGPRNEHLPLSPKGPKEVGIELERTKAIIRNNSLALSSRPLFGGGLVAKTSFQISFLVPMNLLRPRKPTKSLEPWIEEEAQTSQLSELAEDPQPPYLKHQYFCGLETSYSGAEQVNPRPPFQKIGKASSDSLSDLTSPYQQVSGNPIAPKE
jgi:hypothetical protein